MSVLTPREARLFAKNHIKMLERDRKLLRKEEAKIPIKSLCVVVIALAFAIWAAMAIQPVYIYFPGAN